MRAGSRLAVLGGGPIGLEAALAASLAGFDVAVYERGDEIAASVRDWGHVSMFTPWSLNTTARGRERLASAGVPLIVDLETCPTGREFVDAYLVPLSRTAELVGRLHLGTRVRGITRSGLLKTEAIPATGDARRDGRAFLLHLDSATGESVAEADIVLDCTGVYGGPAPVGRGGFPCPGERAAASRIVAGLPDVNGRDRARFEGRDVLVVGDGLSAATTVVALADSPARSVVWATRSGAPPLAEIPNDPLPRRRELIARANRLAADGTRVRTIGGVVVERIVQHGLSASAASATDSPFDRQREHAFETGPLEVHLAEESIVSSGMRGRPLVVEVDLIVAQTGFRPEVELWRELQVHQCYASEAPMALAAKLLSSGGASGDCMSQEGHGPDVLRSPEPGFFVLGSKSYGRNSQFLLRIGHQQIEDVLMLLRDPVPA